MIIKRMTAYFGALEGRSLELGPGLNILYAPNESGKSTWCAFLRAMLYGVDTGQRAKQGQQPDKKKYQPWSGAPMSGSMDVETASGPVTLRRWTERAGQPMQAFSATVTGTDVPAGIAAGEAGQTLTGAPREVFERSAFICQAGLGVTPDPELEKRFAAIVSAGDEEQSFSETDKKLRAWLRRRRSGRRGAIPETEAAIAQARSELGRIAEGTRAVEQLERELDQLQVRQEELVRRMEKARAEARRKALSDLAAARAAVLAAESDRRAAEDEKTRAVEALRQTAFGAMGPEQAKERALSDADEAESLARQAGTLPPAWTAFLPLILAAAGLGLWLGGVMGWAWCLALGAAGIAGTVGAWLWLRRAGERRDALLARRTEILEDYGVREPRELDGLLEEYERLWAEAKAAARTLGRAEEALESARRTQKAAEEPVLNGLDFINGDSEAARASRAVTQGREEMERLRERRAIAEGRARAMGDPMALESELTALEERRDALRASKLLQERAFAEPKLAFLWDSVVEKADGNGMLEAITVRNVKTGERTEIRAEPKDGLLGLFGFIGYLPNTALFEGALTLESGYIRTDDEMRTGIDGVFAAGDVRVKSVRQVVTAAADGAAAAVQAGRYLESK